MAARLFPYLSYPDAPAALRWLGELGFSVVRRQDGDSGQVVHAEVRLDGVVLMVSSDDDADAVPTRRPSPTGRGLYLLVDDVDEFFRRAVAAGAASVIVPEDTPWGSRRARVLDLGGVEWSFGTYEPGRA